jgi:hypothetical protein
MWDLGILLPSGSFYFFLFLTGVFWHALCVCRCHRNCDHETLLFLAIRFLTLRGREGVGDRCTELTLPWQSSGMMRLWMCRAHSGVWASRIVRKEFVVCVLLVVLRLDLPVCDFLTSRLNLFIHFAT